MVHNTTPCQRPCPACPFRRDTTNPPVDGGVIGGADATVYIGQAHGPFLLPCHMAKNYELRRSEPDKVLQCAGAAVFRANIGFAQRMPDPLLKLPADHETVFSTPEQFLSFYRNGTLREAAHEISMHGGVWGLFKEQYQRPCAFQMDHELKRAA